MIFNVADGSVATILKEGTPLAVLKGYQENTWFFGPRAARISRTNPPDERPQFVVVRNRRQLPAGGGLETLGGVFASQIELDVPIPNVEEQNAWTEHIRLVSSISPTGTNTFRFQPMRLRQGVMSIQGIDAYVDDPARYQNVSVGAGPTIPITLELNKLGADTFAAALQSDANEAAQLPVTAFLQFKYDMVVPRCHYRITADARKVYDFFSVNVKARASLWGLVGANADISRTREELVASGAIRIEQISAPEGLNEERIKQLESSIIDSWTKNILDKIAEKPEMNPSEAPDPGGFFGGISVTLKSFTEIQDISLSAEFDYSELAEETYSVSYVFGPLLNLGSPRDYLLDVTEDNKLPIVINLGKSLEVFRYSGQFGYRRQDGTYVANSITDVSGAQGGVLTGFIQFATTEPMPETTEVQLTVDFEDEGWLDRGERHRLTNGESGTSFVFSPGNNIARISIITDLERAAEDTVSIINYRSVLPDYEGNPVNVHSGAIIILGQGEAGERVTSEEISFPYYSGTQSESKLAWDVTIQKPNGDVFTKSGEIPVTQSMLPLLGLTLTRGTPTRAREDRALLRVLPGLFRVHPIERLTKAPYRDGGTTRVAQGTPYATRSQLPPPNQTASSVPSRGGRAPNRGIDAW
jgi:hypothetical protein